MRPLDPQLLRRAPAARGFVVLTATLTAVAAALVIGQALLIAWLVSGLVGQGLGLGDLPRGLVGLGALTFGRAAAAWAQERYALRAAASTISDLRGQLVAHTVALGPRGAGNSTTEVATLATRGLDALLPYLTRYLPALLSAALITPAAVAVLFGLDWVSAVLAIGMIPLVPLFMWLIGTMTRGLAARRLGVVERLGSQVLDLLIGLPTLRAFGREIGPGVRVRALGLAAKSATMRTLRVAFISGMVLELLTTLAVAVIAVSVGLRMVEGGLSLRIGLAVIMLAPEVFLPLRAIGGHFHASNDGLAAVVETMRLLAIPAPAWPATETNATETTATGATVTGSTATGATATRPDGPPPTEGLPPADGSLPADGSPPVDGSLPTGGGPGGGPGGPRAVVFEDVSVRSGERHEVAPAHLTARLDLGPGGRVIALRGPSGGGKSTTIDLLLGLLPPDAGRVSLEYGDGTRRALATTEQAATDSGATDLAAWWGQVVWVPQRPSLPPGTLREIVGGGRPGATPTTGCPRQVCRSGPRAGRGARLADEGTVSGAALEAARLTGLDTMIASLPAGWDTRIGQGGIGLSVGQRQRVALTAALAGGAGRRVLLLDEPTAHLDAVSEQVFCASLAAWRAAGRVAVIVAHRPSLLALADQVIEVAAGEPGRRDEAAGRPFDEGRPHPGGGGEEA